MDDTWIIGIVSSLLAGMILGISTKGSRFKFWVLYLVNGLINSQYILRLKNESKASKYLKKYGKKSKTVKVLKARGHSLSLERGNLSFLFNKNCSVEKIQCMLSDKSDFLVSRAEEIETAKDNYSRKMYEKEVADSIIKVKMISENNSKIHLRLHKEPIVFRLAIMDEYAFLTFFSKNKFGMENPVYMIPSGHIWYKGLLRYFNLIWATSKVA